ncbi:MAG: ribosome recycling factor [Nitrococcus mobilis]|nr:ribosome recycling factor [Nitrococcus mobilis]
MSEDIKKDAAARMRKSIEALNHEFHKIRTGRAHTSLLDHISVAYYGAKMPLNQVASVAVSDPRTLSVTPWEKGMIPVVEKAILESDLGLTPNTAGGVIRIPLPPLTEERRRELIRVVKHEAEQARIAIRNVRRDANSALKTRLKEKEITEDDEKRAEDDIQKLTDKHISEVDNLLVAKEKELMEV